MTPDPALYAACQLDAAARAAAYAARAAADARRVVDVDDVLDLAVRIQIEEAHRA